jgi:hypothetical protein
VCFADLRYINTASEEMFTDIALTIIALQQNSLVTPTSNNKDGNGRLNGYTVSKESTFVKTLQSKLKLAKSESTQNLWLILRILVILGLLSPNINYFADSLLQSLKDDKTYEPNMIGSLLSIHANGALFVNTSVILDILVSYPDQLTSDIAFLEGLESLLAKLSTYVSLHVLSNTADTQAPHCKVPFRLSHSSCERISHIHLT